MRCLLLIVLVTHELIHEVSVLILIQMHSRYDNDKQSLIIATFFERNEMWFAIVNFLTFNTDS